MTRQPRALSGGARQDAPGGHGEGLSVALAGHVDGNPLARSGGVLGLPGVVAERGLVLPEGLPFDEWARVGDTLGRITRATLWWIGDWLVYGERVYGERYAQAMDATGLDYGTLRNAAYVASRFPLSRRRDGLSFSHHQAVAALAPPQQDRWLEAAGPKLGADGPEMTVRELRLVIGVAKGPGSSPDGRYEVESAARRGLRDIIVLAQQGIDGTLPPGEAFDAICAEAMRGRERCKST